MADNSRMYAPCSCGSGKKYRFCCGAVDGTKSRIIRRPPNILQAASELEAAIMASSVMKKKEVESCPE